MDDTANPITAPCAEVQRQLRLRYAALLKEQEHIEARRREAVAPFNAQLEPIKTEIDGLIAVLTAGRHGSDDEMYRCADCGTPLTEEQSRIVFDGDRVCLRRTGAGEGLCWDPTRGAEA